MSERVANGRKPAQDDMKTLCREELPEKRTSFWEKGLSLLLGGY